MNPRFQRSASGSFPNRTLVAISQIEAAETSWNCLGIANDSGSLRTELGL